MGRPKRIHYRAALFHIMARGNDKQDIFLDDLDRMFFLRYVDRVKREAKFELYSYCLMSNHFHLLIRVHDISISQIMHRVLTTYSHRFNSRGDRTGHVFEARFNAFHCDRDSYLKELIRYINMNPVAAGMVSSPEQWPWSSYKELLNMNEQRFTDRERVWAVFEMDGGSQGALRDFVEKKEMLSLDPPIAKETANQIEADPTPMIRRLSLRSLPMIELEVAKSHFLSIGSLQGKSKIRPLAAARRKFIAVAAQDGHCVKDIARHIARSEAFVCRTLRRARLVPVSSA